MSKKSVMILLGSLALLGGSIAVWFDVAHWWVYVGLVGSLAFILAVSWHRRAELVPALKKVGEWIGKGWKKWKPVYIIGSVAFGAVLCYLVISVFLPELAFARLASATMLIGYLMLSIKRIESDTYRTFTVLGSRLFWLGEGSYFVPFGLCWLACSVKYKKENTDGEFELVTKEEDGRVGLKIKFSILWTPDPDNLFTFWRLSRADIDNELLDAAQEILLAIAGNRPVDDFLEKVEFIQLLIECYLSLPREKVPCPHSHNEALDYCCEHTAEIQKLLADNTNKSEAEKKLGTRHEMFSLSGTKLPKLIQEAMEAPRRAKEERKAAKIRAESDQDVAKIKAESDRVVTVIGAEANKKRFEIEEDGKEKRMERLVRVYEMLPEKAAQFAEGGAHQSTRTINTPDLGDLVSIAKIIVKAIKE